MPYERLSSLDASFLALETRTTHMHVAAVSVFEAAPLRSEAGGIDIDRIRRFIQSRLHYIPRYRQRLAWIPLERHPVWVDDDHFQLSYHVRHTSLPQPGTDLQLKQLTGRILSQQLDRQKPLWEIWVVEGLEGDRLALISKIHHAMLDGVAGAGIMGVLLNVVPTNEIEDPKPWEPTPPPHEAELVAGEISRRISASFERMRNARRAMDDTRQLVEGGLRKARAVYFSLSSGWLTRAASTPLNQRIGPNRRFDWVEVALADIKEIRKGLGGTVNDVVLAATAGAIRHFLIERRSFTDLDVDFRAMAPVSVRSRPQAGELGNQVAMWLVALPIAEPDPVKRLEAIKEETLRLKQGEHALGAQTIVKASGGAPHTLVSLGARLATGIRPFNLTVTNVPGPQFPMYMLESKLLAQYPVVPLWHRHGVGIALFSYDGTVAWGLNADWDLVPDTDALAACITGSIEELCEASRAARGEQPAPADGGGTRRKAAEGKSATKGSAGSASAGNGARAAKTDTATTKGKATAKPSAPAKSAKASPSGGQD